MELIATVGRSPSCDLVVSASPYVSRKHAELLKEGSGFILQDESTNGTRVNGQSLGKHEFINIYQGDEVYFSTEGPFFFRISPDGAPTFTGFAA